MREGRQRERLEGRGVFGRLGVGVWNSETVGRSLGCRFTFGVLYKMENWNWAWL